MNSLGWKTEKPQGTMYVWLPVPEGYDSTEFSMHLIEKTGVVMSPGVAFGGLGEGYIRAALVAPEKRISEAIDRMKKAGIRFK